MTKNEAHILVLDLKAKYPNPVCASDSDSVPTVCCVGGAFCRATTEESELFPDKDSIARALLRANMYLVDRAYDYAYTIIALNDMGQFNEAWDTLENALCYCRSHYSGGNYK